MRKLFIVFGLALVIGAAALFQNKPQPAAEQPSVSEHNASVVAKPAPANRAECVEAAELDYRVYMIMNTDGFEDVNGTTVYSLAPEKMDTQNIKRANAVDACYKSF